MEFLSHSEAETEALGQRLAAVLFPGAVVAYEGGRLPLFHFDMYRLDNADALFDIGWEDYLDRGGVCAVEWSEQVTEALPPDTIRVCFARCPEADNWRTITIEGVELPS